MSDVRVDVAVMLPSAATLSERLAEEEGKVGFGAYQCIFTIQSPNVQIHVLVEIILS